MSGAFSTLCGWKCLDAFQSSVRPLDRQAGSRMYVVRRRLAGSQAHSVDAAEPSIFWHFEARNWVESRARLFRSLKPFGGNPMVSNHINVADAVRIRQLLAPVVSYGRHASKAPTCMGPPEMTLTAEVMSAIVAPLS